MKAFPFFLLFSILATLTVLGEENDPMPIVERAMAIVDLDRTGKLSLEEFLPLDVQARHHGKEHFQEGDFDNDGFLNPKELATELARKQTWFVILVEGVEPCFSRLDTDHNGKLDPEEYRKVSRMGGHAEHHHRSADTDDDGFLNPNEFATHANAKLKSAANICR